MFKAVIKYFCELDDDEAAFKSVYDFLVAKEDKKNIPALDNSATEEKLQRMLVRKNLLKQW